MLHEVLRSIGCLVRVVCVESVVRASGGSSMFLRVVCVVRVAPVGNATMCGHTDSFVALPVHMSRKVPISFFFGFRRRSEALQERGKTHHRLHIDFWCDF